MAMAATGIPALDKAVPTAVRAVATVAVGNARNAGLLAVRILGASDPRLSARMLDFQAALRASAIDKGAKVRGDG